MKVAYITNYNSEDVHYWSGTGYYIAESLEKQGVELIRIDCHLPFTLLQRIRRKLAKLFANRLLLIERETSYLKKLAEKAGRMLSQTEYDIVFSPGSLSITYLKSDKPIVFFTDATYEGYRSLYLQNQKLCKRSIVQGNLAEGRAIKNASLIFYTSDWARQSAIKKYGGDGKKILHATVGANLVHGKSDTEIEELINERRQKKEKTFLFIGVDWYRKGARKAIETVTSLKERGIQSTLLLVGCKIPPGESLPAFVKHYPFISKATKQGRDFLNKLFEETDFFILPTTADCTPVVFAEAASYGIPVITTDVGGCTSMVLDKETGFCIKEDQFVAEATRRIIELCGDEKAYGRMGLNAYKHYQKKLNWNVIGEKTISAMRPLIAPADIVRRCC